MSEITPSTSTSTNDVGGYKEVDGFAKLIEQWKAEMNQQRQQNGTNEYEIWLQQVYETTANPIKEVIVE